ncbi:RnfH family protein [Vibrio sp. HA2012]|uniref:RnfH family protein n=1 Tax=Vibrio sp. HA2012 TaxID=1971595 RepID=UPI000C2C4E3A|nr:RnfH family protein [Vibrio sp. HA2012]PJC87627.1 RnfH family protein [Vibrio sp. HA2012]
MKVSVAYALKNEQVWLPVDIEDNATLMTAIHTSGILSMFPDIRLDTQKVGVFGKLSSLEATLNEGDRVEIYRPLIWQPDDEDDDEDD